MQALNDRRSLHWLGLLIIPLLVVAMPAKAAAAEKPISVVTLERVIAKIAPLGFQIDTEGIRRTGGSDAMTVRGATLIHPKNGAQISLSLTVFRQEAAAKEEEAKFRKSFRSRLRPRPDKLTVYRVPVYPSTSLSEYPHGEIDKQMEFRQFSEAEDFAYTGWLRRRDSFRRNADGTIDEASPVERFFLASYGVTVFTGRMRLTAQYTLLQNVKGWNNPLGGVMEEIDLQHPNHLDEALAVAHAFLALDGNATTPRLTVSALPGELVADGRAQATVSIRVTETRGDAMAQPVPLVGESITLSIEQELGVRPGTLSAPAVTTDAAGRAEVVYTAPRADELKEGRIRAVHINAASARLGLKDEVGITLVSEEGLVDVRPHYGATLRSSRGVIPADARFPATVEVAVLDAAGKPRRNVRVSFTISGKEKRGEMSAGSSRGARVECLTDDAGYAEASYFYTGAAVTGKPYLQEITIASPDMARPHTATVSVGVDLKVESVRNMSEGRGEINAREPVPLVIAIRDALHPEVVDASPVFSHWVSRPDNGPRMGIRLKIEPTGNLPTYLLQRFSIRDVGNPGFDELVTIRPDLRKKESILWLTEGGALAGVPRIEPRYPGINNYALTVSLVDLSSGKAIEDPAARNNTGYLSIPVGLPAEAGAIWFLEDPFGPHTPQSRFFIWVLNQAKCGVLLKPSQVFTLINKGDIQGMVDFVVGEAAGRMYDYIGDQFPAEVVSAALGMSIVRDLIQMKTDMKDAYSLSQAHTVSLVMKKLNLEGMKIVAVTGGDAVVRSRKTGEALPAVDGRIIDLPGVKGGAAFRQGNLTLYVVPEDYELGVTGGQEAVFQ